MVTAPSRRLTLLRHAHAAPADASTPDRDRVLDARGLREAGEIGDRLREAGARPSLIITSPAARAARTARLVARALGYPQEFVQRESALYLATAEDILGVLAAQDDAFKDILVCGHNPGLSDLACRLSAHPVQPLVTAALVIIELTAGHWAENLPGGRLVANLRPEGYGADSPA